MVTDEERDPSEWWPIRANWPEYGPNSYMADAALALLILEDIVIPLAPAPGTKAPTLHVNCNDVFWWACADCEPLPLIGFGKDKEAAFWDLYQRVRTETVVGFGSDSWCCLQRGMRPQTPIEKEWREAGVWSDELEALPSRDPKDCG